MEDMYWLNGLVKMEKYYADLDYKIISGEVKFSDIDISKRERINKIRKIINNEISSLLWGEKLSRLDHLKNKKEYLQLMINKENVEEINNIIDLLNTIEETLSPEEIEKDSCQLISLIEKIPEFFQFALMRSKE